MDLKFFKSFVLEKLLLSLVHRHTINNVTMIDNGFEITTGTHKVIGIDSQQSKDIAEMRVLSIYTERNGDRSPLIDLCYSEDTKYHMSKDKQLSTFMADVLSPLNSIFDDWDHDRLAVISFGYKDPVRNLFRYRLIVDQKNTIMMGRSKSGFNYAFLDSDMRQFLDNRDAGIGSNIILRRVSSLSGHAITPEMPFEPAFELFEDECSKPLRPLLKNGELISGKPLYWYKSPTTNSWIVILSIDKNKGEGYTCRSGYMEEEPSPGACKWMVYSIRKTQVFYITAHRRYQIFRGEDCIDISHLIRKRK